MPRKKVSAKRWIAPGKASDYIEDFATLAEQTPCLPVVICCRVSGHTQNHNGNLDNSEGNLQRVARKHGAAVVDCFCHVGSGTDPIWLAGAVELAKDLNAILLAETTDRFIRSTAYHSKKNPNAQASETDLQELQRWTKGVTLATHLHPDATPEEVRGYQRKRGQQQKGRKGGRPKKKPGGHKKRQRLNGKWKVYVGMGWFGWSAKKIAKEFGLPLTNVRRWAAELLEECLGELLGEPVLGRIQMVKTVRLRKTPDPNAYRGAAGRGRKPLVVTSPLRRPARSPNSEKLFESAGDLRVRGIVRHTCPVLSFSRHLIVFY